MRRQTDQQEIEDMVPTEYRNGQATRYEIVTTGDADVTRAKPIGWDDAPIVAPVQSDRLPRVQHIVQSDAIGEARAFNIRVSSLAAVLGGGAVLLAALFGASFSAWAGIMIFGSVFALTWAGAFVLDAFTSAGGIELFHAMRLWRHLDREQAHRHNRYNAPPSDRLRLLQTVLGALTIGSTVLVILAFVVAVAWENMPK